jgi:Holliday junction resolvasome RuvABC DNA-binding subunit
MKTFTALLSILVLSLSLSAAETAPKKKSSAKPKASAAEAAKPSAKVEAIAKTLTASQKTKLLALLNDGDDAALTSIPNVGETRAAAIKKARPFADVTNVVSVEGVGEATFAEMVAHAKAGFPQPDKKEAKEEPAKKKAPAAKSKSTPKKKDSKSSK